jgi:hypothetical protein
LHEKRKEMRLQKKLTHNQEPGSIQWTIVAACTITKRKEKKTRIFFVLLSAIKSSVHSLYYCKRTQKRGRKIKRSIAAPETIH